MERSDYPNGWGDWGLISNEADIDLSPNLQPLLSPSNAEPSHGNPSHLWQPTTDSLFPLSSPSGDTSDQYEDFLNFWNPTAGSSNGIQSARTFDPLLYNSHGTTTATASTLVQGPHDPMNITTSPASRNEDSTPAPLLPVRSRSRQARRRTSRKSPLFHPSRVSKRLTGSMPADSNILGMICLLLMESRSGVMPSNKEFQTAGRLFKVPPDALRERCARMTGDSGYHSASAPHHDITKKYEVKQPISTEKTSGTTGTPDDPMKDLEKPYACTDRCGKKYATRASWERHEQTHYRQQIWVCHDTCRNRASGKQIWLREDHFKKHLIDSHHYDKDKAKEHCKASCLAIDSRFPRRCHFPECAEGFETWKARMDHMASHMMSDYDTSTWGQLVDEARESSVLGETSRDTDSESCDRDSNGQDDDDDFEDGQNGPGTGGSGFANGPDGSSQPEGQGPSNSGSGQRGQPELGTGGGGSSGRYDQGNSFTINHMIMLAGTWLCSQNTNDQVKLHWTLRDLRLSTIRWLGCGATAIVDEVQNKGARETMARKSIVYKSPPERKRVDKEAYIMHRLRHSHVTRLVSSFSDNRTGTLFMSPAADYTLAHYMQTLSPVALDIPTTHWFNCLVSGLRHIHDQGIIHGDIKPENILIFEHRVFYSDFGHSSIIPDDESTVSDAGFVTKQYSAPEIKHGRRGKPSDVWSLGCVFLELITIMLHQSVTELYDVKKENLGRIQRDQSYSSNPKALAQWIRSLKHAQGLRSAPSGVLTALVCSEGMTNLEPKKRPVANGLAKLIPSYDCCSTFECGIPRKHKQTGTECHEHLLNSVKIKNDNCLKISTSNSMALFGIVTPTMAGRRSPSKVTRLGGPTDSSGSKTSEIYSPMLLSWLRELNSYEALITGCTEIYTPQSQFSEPDTLASLKTQLDSLSMAEADVEAQRPRPMTAAKDVNLVNSTQSEELTSMPLPSQSARLFPEIVNGDDRSLRKLKVYSRATRTWVQVFGALDTSTRQDWISEELLLKLGALKEAPANDCVYVDSQGRRMKSCLTVQLRWHEVAYTQARQNWFPVTQGSFDIVIGSDFLLTHGLYSFYESSLLTSKRQTLQGE